MSETTKNTAEILPISIENEMRSAYLDYAMSVIVSRAIPDARDGLKPVHRRILYAMKEMGVDWNRAYKKSARIVGDVMGKYHPHGDSAIYDALVRMAQDFSLRVPLVDGQGNFGSMDGDSAAAMRYTESRLTKAAHALLEDIDKDTVDWQPNYDGSEKEPTVLPAQFPNLLANGTGGIAVGMATNIPPYNLGELIDACFAIMDNAEITVDELAQIIPGPDFPTGGLIMGRSGSYSALGTGRGSVRMRGKAEVQENAGREAIIITEIPYQVNKAHMVERIAELVKEKKIEGITDLRDESDKTGVRVVVEIKRDAVGDVVLNQLYKHTPLQTSFGVNMLALDRGRPRLMNIREILGLFLEHREEVISRRINFQLGKARDRAHILIGLSIAVANIDEVIRLIRAAKDVNEAREKLMGRSWPAADVKALIELVDDQHNKIQDGDCYFTDVQAKAVLEMRLSKLTGLEMEKITEEMTALAAEIADYLDILGSRERLLSILREELLKAKEEFATPRRTEISESEFEEDVEDLIQREDMVVTVTHGGYIKRVPLATYRAQRRGGKGRSGMAVREEDVIVRVFVANTHTPVLFFSSHGKVYKLKVYKLPMGSPQSQGRSLMNIFPLEDDEKINIVMPLPEDEDTWGDLFIMFATSQGSIRRNSLADFKHVQSNGKIAMKLEGTEQLVSVKICKDKQHILLATKSGKAIRCPAEAVRVFKGRNSTGVRGIRLEGGDEIIAMNILNSVVDSQDTEKRDEFLRIPVETRIEIAELEEEADIAPLLKDVETSLDYDTIRFWARAEEFILTVTENGYGKRSSAYEYRATGRGGKGIVNIVTSERNGEVVNSLPVEAGDQIMLVTNRGKLIRTPVEDIRIAGRNTQGVTLFRTAEGEKVMSAARIVFPEDEAEEADNEPEDDADGVVVAADNAAATEITTEDAGDAELSTEAADKD